MSLNTYKETIKIKLNRFSTFVNSQFSKSSVSIIVYVFVVSSFVGLMLVLENKLAILSVENLNLRLEKTELEKTIKSMHTAVELLNKKLESTSQILIDTQVVAQPNLILPLPASDGYGLFFIKLAALTVGVIVVGGLIYWGVSGFNSFVVDSLWGDTVSYFINFELFSVNSPRRLTELFCVDNQGNKINAIISPDGLATNNVITVARANSDLWIPLSDLIDINIESIKIYSKILAATTEGSSLSPLTFSVPLSGTVSSGGGSIVAAGLSSIDGVASGNADILAFSQTMLDVVGKFSG